MHNHIYNVLSVVFQGRIFKETVILSNIKSQVLQIEN